MDDARLNLAVKSLEGASLVEVDGDLGPWTVEAFDKALRAAAHGGPAMLIVDLTKVTSMDIGALKVLQNACAALGSGGKLCTIARGEARKVLEITRLDEMLEVYSELHDALENIAKPGTAA